MKDKQLINLIANQYNVNCTSLKPVSVYSCSNKVIQWAKSFFLKGECFSNARNLCVKDNVDAVVGYVVLDNEVVIEHAWNRGTQGDFDLTFDLFLRQLNYKKECRYFELVHLPNVDVQNTYRANKQIHQDALSIEKEYFYLFNA